VYLVYGGQGDAQCKKISVFQTSLKKKNKKSCEVNGLVVERYGESCWRS